MKKLLSISIVLVMLVTMLFATGVFADENKTSGQWLHITVKNLETNKNKVDIRVPFALIEWALSMDEFQDEVKINNSHCDIDSAKLIKMLNEIGKDFLIEVTDYDEGEYVKIWVE